MSKYVLFGFTGWTAPVEAGFLTFRILDWKYHKSRGTMNTRDYNNAKVKFKINKHQKNAVIGLLMLCGRHPGWEVGFDH